MSSQSANSGAPSSPQGSKGVPAWLAAGLLGAAIGAGAGTLITYNLRFDPELYDPITAPPDSSGGRGGPPGGGGAGGMAGMMGMMGGGGAGGGGGGGMGMMGGGMGGGGGPRPKRDLTSMVGKLTVASKGIHFELTPEQMEKLSTRVSELEKAEKMTDEDAEQAIEDLRGILTEEQVDVLASFELPRPRTGGPSPASASVAGGPPEGAAGAAPPPADENPFKQEANQKRLDDLRQVLKPKANAPAENP